MSLFMLYTVYILFSIANEKIYIGQTSNLLLRFKSHNGFGKGWTMKYRPWVVVYCEYFNNRIAAIRREKQMKSAQGREWIWHKIKNEFKHNGFISA